MSAPRHTDREPAQQANSSRRPPPEQEQDRADDHRHEQRAGSLFPDHERQDALSQPQQEKDHSERHGPIGDFRYCAEGDTKMADNHDRRAEQGETRTGQSRCPARKKGCRDERVGNLEQVRREWSCEVDECVPKPSDQRVCVDPVKHAFLLHPTLRSGYPHPHSRSRGGIFPRGRQRSREAVVPGCPPVQAADVSDLADE